MNQKVTRKKTTSSRSTTSKQAALPTFMDHIRELQSRLFAVGLCFVFAAAAAYPFFQQIVEIIVSPLGKDNKLIYLTPGGAFGFIIQVCMYAGIIGALPMIIFHLYRFLMPAVRLHTIRAALGYTVASILLAVCGVLFAYFVGLPAALKFLTGFELYQINPMLTIDSYFSFVMTYLLAGALIFQLPLIMMIIDSVTPLPPKKLMNFQRHMIVISFIVAAIITPTPDVMNQVLIASPMVATYQVGIVATAVGHRSARRRQQAEQSKKQARVVTQNDKMSLTPLVASAKPNSASAKQYPTQKAPVTSPAFASATRPQVKRIDGFGPRTNNVVSREIRQARGRVVVPHRVQSPHRTIDGFMRSRKETIATKA